MAGDYINRSALLGYLNDIWLTNTPTDLMLDDERELAIATCDGIQTAMDGVKCFPAAGVVAVVRCCECVYHDDDSTYHYCHKWRRNCPNDSDFFCKWGKRKEGGRDNAE